MMIGAIAIVANTVAEYLMEKRNHADAKPTGSASACTAVGRTSHPRGVVQPHAGAPDHPSRSGGGSRRERLVEPWSGG